MSREERTNTADGRTEFAGYYRDAVGQDYANARYYSATSGSFWSPDPVDRSGRARCGPADDPSGGSPCSAMADGGEGGFGLEIPAASSMGRPSRAVRSSAALSTA